MTMKIPVLKFHSLDDRKDAFSCDPQRFGRCLEVLGRQGYRTLDLKEAVDRKLAGGQAVGDVYVLTFDDGYRSVYEEAFPLLQKFSLTATVFLSTGRRATGSTGKRLPSRAGRTMLSWAEIREMRKFGVCIGAHSMSHIDLTRLPYPQAREEILGSKSIIEDALGEAVVSFAYPFGRWDRQSRRIVQQHFACGVCDQPGLLNRKSDIYAIERVPADLIRPDKPHQRLKSPLFRLHGLLRRIAPRSSRPRQSDPAD